MSSPHIVTATLTDELRRPSVGRRMRKALPIYAALSPYFFLFLVFAAIPMVFTLLLAFTDWSGLGSANFVGLENFRYLISDHLFYKSLGNTLILWAMGTIPTLIIATIVALMLNKTMRFSTTYRVIYLVPNITSMVAMGILFSSIFSSQFGLANAVRNLLGQENIAWLQSEWGIKIAISSLTVWSFVGYNALLILAGLQAIDKTQYEAAAIDGANGWQTFFHVTLPQLRAIVLFITLMSTIGSLQSFTEAQVLTSSQSAGAASAGGVNNSGLTMVLYFYSVAFQETGLAMVRRSPGEYSSLCCSSQSSTGWSLVSMIARCRDETPCAHRGVLPTPIPHSGRADLAVPVLLDVRAGQPTVLGDLPVPSGSHPRRPSGRECPHHRRQDQHLGGYGQYGFGGDHGRCARAAHLVAGGLRLR